MLFANWTTRSPSATNSSGYAAAIIDQLNYSLTRAPRAPNNAISHRADQVQLWSDSVYMLPPFLAYFGALHKDSGVMRAAFDQVCLGASSRVSILTWHLGPIVSRPAL